MTKKNMIMKLFFWAVVLILVVCAGVSLVSGRSGIAVNANSSTYSLDGSSMPSGNTDSEDPALPDPKKSEPAADPDGPKNSGPGAKSVPDPKPAPQNPGPGAALSV